MNFWRILYRCLGIGALVLMFSACTDDVLEDTSADVPESGKSEGKFVFYASDYVANWEEGAKSRSLVALSDEVQKQIHNLFYFFYGPQGYLEKIYYQDVTPTMRLEVPFDKFAEGVAEDGIVYVIANTMDPTDISITNEEPVLASSLDGDIFASVSAWKSNVATVAAFQQHSLFPIFYGLEKGTLGAWRVGRPDHVVMFGYYDGTLLKGDILQIALGRMCARMRISLFGAGMGEQVRLTINNAPLQSALYPDVATMPDGNEYWYSFEETLDNGNSKDNIFGDLTVAGVGADGWYGGISGTAGNYTASPFYYCGENYYYYTNKKTTLKIEVWNTKDGKQSDKNLPVTRTGTPDRTYEIDLAHDAPDILEDEDAGPDIWRDYSIYRNTSYTFQLELLPASAKARSGAKGTVRKASDGHIQLSPL